MERDEYTHLIAQLTTILEHARQQAEQPLSRPVAAAGLPRIRVEIQDDPLVRHIHQTFDRLDARLAVILSLPRHTAGEH